MIDPVVSMQWLEDRRRDIGGEAVEGGASEVVVVDVRWYLDGRSGLDAYLGGHIPGAVFVDLERCLARPGSPADGRHPLPEPTVFAESMGALGISDTSTVVAYDDAGGVIAARLVWMLRVTGHDAALLDGGIGAYNGTLETSPSTRPTVARSVVPWPVDRLADIDEVANDTLAHQDLVVLDARDANRFRGDFEPVDPRAGHIPGARNLPCRENLDGEGRLLPAATLRERFEAVGVDDSSEVVSYCGSGVTACFNLLALEVAGFPPGRLFPGSWSQYSHAPDRPAVLGE